VTPSLEDVLQATLAERAGDAPEFSGVLDHVRRGVARRRRRNIAAVATLAAGGVVAVIVAVAVVVSGGRHHAPTPATQPLTTTTTRAPTSTTTTVPPTTSRVAPAVSLHSVRWGAVRYPIASRCSPVGVRVVQVAYVDPGPRTHDALVLAECNSGAGTPPVVLYVYDRASSARNPHLAATLVADTDQWQASSFSANGADLTMPAYGFSSNNVPNCCPDVRTTLAWRWNGSGYVLTSPVPAHVRLPNG
jgi:hypothetical protein